MDVKSFLFSWCSKKSLSPLFDIRGTGPKHRQRFLCEVRIDGYTYVGAGNSVTKKEAQKNASRDFINFLVRSGEIAAADVPADLNIKPESGDASASGSGESSGIDGGVTSMGPPKGTEQSQQSRPIFKEGMGPESMGQAYHAIGGQSENFTYMDRLQQQKNVEEAEDLDVNASLHGNWTMENAKSKLHQFMQMNKINADYVYKAVGPDHTRFVDSTFYCQKVVKAKVFIGYNPVNEVAYGP